MNTGCIVKGHKGHRQHCNDAEIAWYISSTNCWISLEGLEGGIAI